jgi:hypothetical protein
MHNGNFVTLKIEETKLQKPNFIYSYYLPDINSIKVGHGDDPRQRMISYTKKYSVNPDYDSLKTWEMPSSGIASNIENSCHHVLIKSGFVRSKIFDDDNEANEIFELGDFSYADAVSLVVEEIDANINYLKKSLEGKSFGEQHRQVKKSEEIKKKKEEKREEKIQSLMIEIKEGYEVYYSQYISVQKQSNKHLSTFKYQEVGLLERLTKGQKTQTEQFLEWSGLEKHISFVPKILKSSRIAREFFHHIHENNDVNLVHEAESRIGINLWNHDPGNQVIWELPVPSKGVVKMYNPPRFESYKKTLKEYGGKIDMAVYEVYLCMGGGTNWHLLRENKTLSSLVEWARLNPPIESTLPD